MAAVQGTCDPAFARLKQLLADNAASGAELGASICVNIDGRNVVDIWAGYTDEQRTTQWEENTILNVWSCSKAVTNLALLIAADRGLIDVHEKVATYWPEFAQHGKGNIEVRHILSHSSGLPGWPREISMEECCDTAASTAELIDQPAWWEPGTASGYHGVSQGHLVGELIRRVSGKPLKQFIAEEMAGPLGADFQLGALEKDWPRISTILPPPPVPASFRSDPTSIAYRTFTRPIMRPLHPLEPIWRRSEFGAANGHGNARSLNRILSIISLGGEVDGVRLLSPKTIDSIFEEQTNGRDFALGFAVRFGIGFALPLEKTIAVLPPGRKAFWGGWGGSLVVMDCDSRMTFTYAMNKMGGGILGGPRTAQYLAAAYEGLAQLRTSSKL